ncbi:MAG: RluA family pseudouridine synthase [Treponema sp.]|nr:RluA family pseudouridine synthase [Treponema sp.]
MFPPFPQEAARHYTQELISDIEDGLLYLKQISSIISSERQNAGIMLGSLVCAYKRDRVNCNSTDDNHNVDNNNFVEKVVLHAVSGIAKQLKITNQPDNVFKYSKKGITHIIVPSIASNQEVTQALLENDSAIHTLTEKINSLTKNSAEYEKLFRERKTLCDISLKKVFSLYNFTRFDGKQITLNSIISKHGNLLPPTGTGDCCAPKLLSYAFENNLQPLSMDEVFYGTNTKNKISGKSYDPCNERCGYILPEILGLNILYRDKDLVVINKQSGLLSVPGRGEDKIDSAEFRLKKLFPECPNQPAVHRLDMETSGLLILALNPAAHQKLNKQFEEGLVHKKYEAILQGILEKADGLSVPKNSSKNGIIKLKFRLDPENRPHQIYDQINGKEGITEYQIMNYQNYTTADGTLHKTTRITFIPHTGRTHQLRLVSADPHGFHCPIIGDTLYGNPIPNQRLLLHAKEITFFHPVSGKKMHFTSNPDF